MRVAKADLVPTDHNLRPAYADFGELEAACEAFMADVNTRPHRSTMEAPVIRLAEEHDTVAPAATVAAHAVFRGDPEGELAVADQCGWRAVLRPARAGRSARVGRAAPVRSWS